jgi:large subunit ribosomal protein L4
MAEMTNSFDAAAYTGNGTARERVPLPGDMFDGVGNKPVLHQAVKAFHANQRPGNAATKTRGRVIGGNQ